VAPTHRLCAPVAALIVLLVSEEGAAFCRRTTCPTCPVDANGCPTGGKPVFWPKQCVAYALGSAASRQVGLSEATEIAARAFRAWQTVTCPGTNAPPSIDVSDAFGPTDCGQSQYDPGGANANAIIFHDDQWPYPELSDAVALTKTHFDEASGYILDSDIEIDATLPLSTSDVVPEGKYDLLSILTHEAGHFLGLAHSYQPGAAMQPSYRPGRSDQRTLGDDDIAGVCAIYPPDRVALPCDAAPQGGFQSECSAAEASGGCSVAPRSSNGRSLPPLALLALAFASWRRRSARLRIRAATSVL
jgi:hypothetical protein